MVVNVGKQLLISRGQVQSRTVLDLEWTMLSLGHTIQGEQSVGHPTFPYSP